MLCHKCKQRQATVHITWIVKDKMRKFDLCGECAPPNLQSGDPKTPAKFCEEFFGPDSLRPPNSPSS